MWMYNGEQPSTRFRPRVRDHRQTAATNFINKITDVKANYTQCKLERINLMKIKFNLPQNILE